MDVNDEHVAAAERFATIFTHVYVQIVQPMFKAPVYDPEKLQPWLRDRIVEAMRTFPEILS